MIERLVPDWVAVAESCTDASADFDRLFPAEREVIANAVAKRRAEFSTVRACARRALAELGVPAAPILPGERGAPCWPDGVVGSMTHCEGYRAAAVARGGQASAIGIDAEPHAPLPDGVLGLVARPEEFELIAALQAQHRRVHWDRVLFVIKESVYKSWFPMTQRWLDFLEASVDIEPAAGSFVARLLVAGPQYRGHELRRFSGRFQVASGFVQSAIVLPACGLGEADATR